VLLIYVLDWLGLDLELVQIFMLTSNTIAAIDLFCFEVQIVSQVVEWRRL
jgi:hypothetical protein